MRLNTSVDKLTKNIFSLTAVQIATYVLPLLSVPIISRIIGPEKYGVINFASAYITYFTLLISYSFDFTATRRIAKDPTNEINRNVVFNEIFYTQCLIFIVATTIFSLLLFIIPELNANKKIIVFSYLVCIAALFSQNWLFQAMQDLSKVAIFNLISRLLFTVMVLLIVKKNSDYIWQPILIGLIQTIVSIWSFVWAFKKYKISFIKVPLIRCWQILCEDKTIFFSLIFVNLYSSTNTVILGLYQNAEQVGYYTAGQRLISIAQSVLAMPLAQAFYPFIGKAFGESREKGLQVVHKLIPLIIAFIGLSCIVLFIVGPTIIRIFYGKKFEPAIPVFQLLTVMPLISSLSNVLGIQIMLNLGMDKNFFRVTAYAGLFSLLLNLVMIKSWGYMGTTINWLVTELFILIGMYIVLKRKNINPININYFTLSALMEYINPLSKKVTFRK